MDKDRFERLAGSIVSATGCKQEKVGEDDSPEFKFTFRVEEDHDRKQEINLWPFEEDGKDFVRMVTYVGKKQDFSTNKLLSFLELNSSLRFGAMALFQGEVAMVDTAHFESAVDEAKIIEQMKYLIKMADSLEKSMIGLDRK